jgi:hypothetical protein
MVSTSLFDDKNLTGWKSVDGPKWSWADGRLLGSPAPTKTAGFLVTEADYQDFELELQYRLAPGSGSGLFLRADANGADTGKGQLEVQIADDEAFILQPLNATGAVYNIFPRKVAPTIRRGDWNTARVRLVKRHIEVWINGTQTIDINLDDARDKAAAVPGLTRVKGGIGLQLNQQASVEFRNVRIRPLPN